MDKDRKPGRGLAASPDLEAGSCAQLSLLDLLDPARDQSLMEPRQFAQAVVGLAAEPVRVVLTSNHSSLISVKLCKDGVREARIQEAFRAADPRTLKALARFIVKPDRRSRQAIDAFIREQAHLFEAMARDRAPARAVTKGQQRDLARVLAKVRRDYGLQIKDLAITWGKRGPGVRGKRSIKFGSYCHKTRTITIHPELDRADVPGYFVEYIVYHEALHAVFPPVAGDGRRREVHGPEFKRFEKKFAEYDEARKFERHYVKNLMR